MLIFFYIKFYYYNLKIFKSKYLNKLIILIKFFRKCFLKNLNLKIHLKLKIYMSIIISTKYINYAHKKTILIIIIFY